jgi:hypothetical protein
MTNRPARARPEDAPPNDWVSLSIACLASVVAVAAAVAFYLAWPLL